MSNRAMTIAIGNQRPDYIHLSDRSFAVKNTLLYVVPAFLADRVAFATEYILISCHFHTTQTNHSKKPFPTFLKTRPDNIFMITNMDHIREC